jgi:hypothetical protein
MLKRAFAILTAVAMTSTCVDAATIALTQDPNVGGGVGGYDSFTNYDITTNAATAQPFADWAAWAVAGQDGNGIDQITRSANDAATGQISALTGVTWVSRPSGKIKYTFANGVASGNDFTYTPWGGSPTFVPVPTSFNGDASQTKSAQGGTVSFTTKMFAPDETLTLYLFSDSGNATSNVSTANMTASLDVSGASQTLTGEVLHVNNSWHDTWGFARYTLSVTGAAVGETLSFSIADTHADVFGPDGNIYTGVGISAVSIDGVTVPEPASMAVLGLGGLALMRRRRVA